MSPHLSPSSGPVPAPMTASVVPWRRVTSRVIHWASSTSSSAWYRTIGSPVPWSVHSSLGLRATLLAMTALAASRMVWVDR